MRYIFVLVLLFSLSHADRDGGPYIGIGYGVSQHNTGSLSYTTPPSDLKNDKSYAGTIYVGAYINKYLSVELNYADFTGFSKSDGYEIDDTTYLNYYAITTGVLAHYAFFNDVWDFYAKLQAGEIHRSSRSDKGFATVYGVGTSVRFNELLSLKAAYDYYRFGYDEAPNDNSADYILSIDYLYIALEFQF